MQDALAAHLAVEEPALEHDFGPGHQALRPSGTRKPLNRWIGALNHALGYVIEHL
jgi:hypothetical protein